MPMYVELAPAGSTPVAGTAAALLRSYLGILAYYFRQPAADCSPAGIAAAIGNLPGLLMQDGGHAQEEIAVAPSLLVGGLAAILANLWDAPARSPNLLSLARPMIARPGSATLLVLQRPANEAPVLESMRLTLNVQRSPAPPVQPAQPTQQAATLSIDCARTSWTVFDSSLASSLAFAADLGRQGLIADLAKTPGYVAIPLS
jgi:hypothetical protein